MERGYNGENRVFRRKMNERCKRKGGGEGKLGRRGAADPYVSLQSVCRRRHPSISGMTVKNRHSKLCSRSCYFCSRRPPWAKRPAVRTHESSAQLSGRTVRTHGLLGARTLGTDWPIPVCHHQFIPGRLGYESWTSSEDILATSSALWGANLARCAISSPWRIQDSGGLCGHGWSGVFLLIQYAVRCSFFETRLWHVQLETACADGALQLTRAALSPLDVVVSAHPILLSPSISHTSNLSLGWPMHSVISSRLVTVWFIWPWRGSRSILCAQTAVDDSDNGCPAEIFGRVKSAGQLNTVHIVHDLVPSWLCRMDPRPSLRYSTSSWKSMSSFQDLWWTYIDHLSLHHSAGE